MNKFLEVLPPHQVAESAHIQTMTSNTQQHIASAQGTPQNSIFSFPNAEAIHKALHGVHLLKHGNLPFPYIYVELIKCNGLMCSGMVLLPQCE